MTIQIHRTSQHLKHHLLLVGPLSVNEWIILVQRPHWQQLQKMIMTLDNEKKVAQ